MKFDKPLLKFVTHLAELNENLCFKFMEKNEVSAFNVIPKTNIMTKEVTYTED